MVVLVVLVVVVVVGMVAAAVVVVVVAIVVVRGNGVGCSGHRRRCIYVPSYGLSRCVLVVCWAA